MYVYCVYLLWVYKYTHMHAYISELFYFYKLNTFIYMISYMNINIDIEM